MPYNCFILESIVYFVLAANSLSFSSFNYLVWFFQLLKPEVFDFIDKHNLHDVIQEKVQLYFVQVKFLNPWFLHMP